MFLERAKIFIILFVIIALTITYRIVNLYLIVQQQHLSTFQFLIFQLFLSLNPSRMQAFLSLQIESFLFEVYKLGFLYFLSKNYNLYFLKVLISYKLFYSKTNFYFVFEFDFFNTCFIFRGNSPIKTITTCIFQVRPCSLTNIPCIAWVFFNVNSFA